MYRRFSLQDLQTIQNKFFQNLNMMLRKEKCTAIKQYLQTIQTGDHIIYFNRNEPTFRFLSTEQTLTLIDEQEAIEVCIDRAELGTLDGLFKRLHLLGGDKKLQTQSIQSILAQSCEQGNCNNIGGKPYIVYDIETQGDIFEVTQQKFIMAYAATVQEGKVKYEYIDQTNVQEFVNKLLNFDGYIIGYNQLTFDNPVIIHNTTKTQGDIQTLNNKSIDLLQFLYVMTGKRVGLNKVSTNLIGIEKTLESGAEVGNLYNKYLATQDSKFLEAAKKYCKNDVKMTLFVLFYFLHFQKILIDSEEVSFTIPELIEKSASKDSKIANNNTVTNVSIF